MSKRQYLNLIPGWPGVSHSWDGASSGRYLVVVIVAIALTSGLFTLLPDLDLAVSRLFFDGTGFPLAEDRHLRRFRMLTEGIGAALLGFSILLLCRRSLRSRMGVRASEVLVPFLAYGFGVGLIVNMFLKEYIGRARPRDVVEFGGEMTFTPVWQISAACQSNCSFTSGEAAGAMAIYSAMTLLPALRPRQQLLLGIAIGCISTALALNRIAFGAHFLSDVLLSMLIVLAIMLATRLLVNGAVGQRIDRMLDGKGASEVTNGASN